MSSYNTKLGFKKISEILSQKSPHIHFLGAGGVGMYSLVRLSAAAGMRVSASDREKNVYTERLLHSGIRMSYGKDLQAVSAATLVVYSLAIDIRDPELIYAGSLGIPRVSRADFLSYLMSRYRTKIAVCGTHGKSTVTAMINAIFSIADIMPTTVSGAELSGGEPYLLGSDDVFIYEACEYRDSFLCMSPEITAVTNIEHDHPDYFDDEAAVRKSFLSAVNNSREFAVLPSDDKNMRQLLPDVTVPYVTYGSGISDYEYAISSIESGGSSFTLRHGERVEDFYLSAIGAHNVANAACAATTALEWGIGTEYIKAALVDFKLPGRRLEYIGEYGGRPVIYDYAHHPTEIGATITALKAWYGDPITVIFKPHTYSRTKALWGGFVRTLTLAEYVILTKIYPAREEPIFDVTSERLARDIGERAISVDDCDVLTALDKTSGVIVIMGAGNLDTVKDMLLGENISSL